MLHHRHVKTLAKTFILIAKTQVAFFGFNNHHFKLLHTKLHQANVPFYTLAQFKVLLVQEFEIIL